MNVSDLCMNAFCGDVAAPAQDYCSACLADHRVILAERDLRVARQTAEHEAQVVAQDETVAA